MFGSIGTLVESSDIQRRAYNAALKEAGLAWEWDRETYVDLLNQAGGKERLAMLASATGSHLMPERIETIHARKTAIACAELRKHGATLRPGVAELIALATSRGMRLAFVTTTYAPNVDAIFDAVGDALKRDDFAYIGTRDDVPSGKPAPDAYAAALERLGVGPEQALAIEDTAVSVMSAKRAGLHVIATPGAFAGDQDFWQADLVVERLADRAGTIDPGVLALLGG